MFKHTLRATLLAALFVAALSSAALASTGSGGTTANPQAGNVLVDDHGMTLYRFTPDQPNTSLCYGGCAQDWPPVIVDAIPATQDPALGANLGIANRTDGSKQLTYLGAPLYYYVDDVQPGDLNGQGIGGVWFAITAS